MMLEPYYLDIEHYDPGTSLDEIVVHTGQTTIDSARLNGFVVGLVASPIVVGGVMQYLFDAPHISLTFAFLSAGGGAMALGRLCEKYTSRYMSKWFPEYAERF